MVGFPGRRAGQMGPGLFRKGGVPRAPTSLQEGRVCLDEVTLTRRGGP